MEPKVGIIGAGTVGTAVATILKQQGYTLVGVYDLDREKAGRLSSALNVPAFGRPAELGQASEVLFLTTNDGAITPAAEEIAREGGFRQGQYVIHMSGALTSEALAPAAAQGAIALSVHPLQSFANSEQAIKILPGSIFSIEGDPEGMSLAQRIVEAMGGRFFPIRKESKPLYHAGACVASNYLVTLVSQAVELLVISGIPREMCLPALLPLVEGTLHNIKQIGIPQALTGPIARGDISTISKHLAQMEGVDTNLVQFYRTLGTNTVDVAVRKGGITREKAEEMLRVLKP
ncbi:MAG: DUF2520 domain-containing protein [Firmicutes bacterium]|nr:DUF2520 domain-containing protein [Bacillota bacterium]